MTALPLSLNFQFLKNKPQDDMCLICRDSFEQEQSWVFFKKIKVLGHEKHLFHPDCLKQWLAAEPSCPTCGGSFSIESLKRVFDRLEESKSLLGRKYAIIIGSVATVGSLSAHVSSSSLLPLGLVSLLSVVGSFKEKDFVKCTAIACATLGFGVFGAAAGLETQGVMLAGCLGASLADELLKSKRHHLYQE